MISVEELIDRLQGDLTRRDSSFAEYITQSSPYIPEGKQEMLALVERLAAQEKTHARQIGRLIIRLGGVPSPGPFEEGAADTNYLSIVYLYGLLLRWKAKSGRELEQRLAECDGYPEAREVLAAIVEAERKQEAELRGCYERHGGIVSDKEQS